MDRPVGRCRFVFVVIECKKGQHSYFVAITVAPSEVVVVSVGARETQNGHFVSLQIACRVDTLLQVPRTWCTWHGRYFVAFPRTSIRLYVRSLL